MDGRQLVICSVMKAGIGDEPGFLDMETKTGCILSPLLMLEYKKGASWGRISF
jgi:hypothetical protein